MLRWARMIFFQDKNNERFSYATEILILKIKNLDLSLYKILCCKLDAYVNSVSYGDSWAHVNYIAFFLSSLWFERDIKSVTISICIRGLASGPHSADHVCAD